MSKEKELQDDQKKTRSELRREREEQTINIKKDRKNALRKEKKEWKKLTGKERRERKKEYKKDWKTAKKKYRRGFWWGLWHTAKILATILLVMFVVGGIGAGWYVYDKYGDMVKTAYVNAKDKMDNFDESIFKDKEETVIYGTEDKILTTLSDHEYTYLPDEEIPEQVKLAIIAIEDERYLEHSGVDIKALTRAMVTLVKNKGEITQGGSTITQQLVKNTMLTQDQVFSRKFEEIFIARELEKTIPKNKILEYYLNNIYFNNGSYGIESASNYYFSKQAKELSLAETTFLIAIPNNPTVYDPIKRKDNTHKRQLRILKKMYENEFITKKQFTDASVEKILLNIKKRVVQPESYLVSYAISDATKQLMKVNGFEMQYDFESAEERTEYKQKYAETFEQYNQDIRNGGYVIKTSLNRGMQNDVQKIVNGEMSYATKKNGKTGIYNRQASSVVIDNKTGLVKAIVGGRTQEDVANTFNRGFLAYRQPGSSIKPILVYTQALEKKYFASSVVVDKAIPKGPKNITLKYVGKTSVENAVIKSINTIPYQLIQEFGVKESLGYLKNMNFTNIVQEDETPVVSIGGFTYGVTPLEMAGAFSTLGRNGEFLEPTAITSIKRSGGEELYKWRAKPKQVYDAGAAYLMTEILNKVAKNASRTGLTAQIDGYITASKTGTSNLAKDVWVAGYSPYYTTVVWVGEDTPRSMNLTSYDDPLEIWSKTMKMIHKGLPKIEYFKRPEGGLFEGYVNPKNGRLSYDKVTGWRKEWIPTSRMKLQLEADRQAEIERKKKAEEAEKKRLEVERKKEEERKKQAEIQRQKEEKIDKWLKSQGSSLAEEKERIEEVKRLMSKLKREQIYQKSSFAKVDEIVEETQKSVNRLLYVEYKETYQKQLDEEMNRVEGQKDQVERAIILQKQNAEREEVRRQEAIKKEEERKRYEALLEQETRAERERLEQERLKTEAMREEQIRQEKERLEQERIKQEQIRKEQEQLEKENQEKQEPSTEE